MANAFKGNRRILWLGGVAVLVLGVLAGALVLPNLPSGSDSSVPAIDVPKMQNPPPARAPNLQVEVEKQE